MDDGEHITGLLRRWRIGDVAVQNELTPLVYEELRTIARRQFRREGTNHTLQPTALVHEAYARLVKIDVDWQDRVHFFSLAARMMRRLLINHAEAKRAEKRGGGALHVTLSNADQRANSADTHVNLLDLADALNALEALDPKKAELISLQYFAGLTTQEMAEATDTSVSTVGRELRFARAWLKDRLSGNA